MHHGNRYLLFEILEPLAHELNHLAVNLLYFRWFIVNVGQTIFIVVVNTI